MPNPTSTTSTASTGSTLHALNRLRGLSPRAASALRDAAAHFERGDLKSAETALLVAHFHAPDHAEVLRLSGMVQYRQDRLRDAVDSFVRSLAVRPDDAVVLTWLGAAQSDLYDFGPALASLRQAASVASDADAFMNLGIEFARQHYSDDALAAADRVLALQPKNGFARLLRAQSRQALGEADGAASDYRALIAMNEHVASAWFGLLDIKTVRIGPEELIALERATGSAGFSEPERIMLVFALGRAYEDEGRYHDAFATFERANAAARLGCEWDALGFTRQVDNVRAAFDVPAAHSSSGLGSEVIFLVGMPRSATTLFEQVLAAHPRVEGAGELPYLSMVLREESNRRRMPFPQWIAGANAEDWERLGNDYLRLSGRWRMQRPISTDKLPENWLLAGAALAMLPGAKVIDCRRDAVETCWSCYKQLFAAGRVGFTHDFSTLAAYWHDYDRLCRFWAERYPTQVRMLSYESFVADPEGETRALLEFCKLDFDAACVRFHEARRSVRSASAAQVRQPLRRDTARADRYGELLAPLRALLEPR
jgi:tetratricopeptide (TPR) repeat protein